MIFNRHLIFIDRLPLLSYHRSSFQLAQWWLGCWRLNISAHGGCVGFFVERGRQHIFIPPKRIIPGIIALEEHGEAPASFVICPCVFGP